MGVMPPRTFDRGVPVSCLGLAADRAQAPTANVKKGYTGPMATMTDEEIDLSTLDIDSDVVCNIMVKQCHTPAAWLLVVHCRRCHTHQGFACQKHHDDLEDQLAHSRNCPNCQMNCGVCGGPCDSITWRKI
jgi:hypothetical protein